MLTVSIESADEPPRSVRLEKLPCRIGRGAAADIALSGWRVAREHARIEEREGTLRVIDEGSLCGTLVNGDRVVEYGPLSESDEILIAGHRLRVLSIQATLHRKSAAPAPVCVERPSALDAEEGDRSAASHRFVRRRMLHRRLLAEFEVRRPDLRQLSDAQLRSHARAVLEEVIGDEPELSADSERSELLAEVLDEAIGLGPIGALLADDSVSEIMVNGTGPIHVERNGRLELTNPAFSSDDSIRVVIDRIIAPLGRHIDEASPMVDARLPDGSRLNAVIAPLSINGPAVTIRRFNRSLLAAEDLIALGALSPAMLKFLRVCVAKRRNVVVSGGTGSGKTTLLNLLARSIGESERVITIEDAAELRLRHRNLVSLEARPANAEGRGMVSIRDLVRNALRMRPDRIVVGECRGGEALDMLQAMNTGHDGSLTTVHANSPRDALSRIEVMALMSGVELPLLAVREQLAAAIHIVVQQARMAGGRRCITEVAEVTGIESGRVLMQTLFRFQAAPGGEGRHIATGHMPSFLDELDGSERSELLALFGGAR
ncbi:MAG: ATPase, T2SS/T4P/T4SS family [Betaproteobacteria bacterium]